MEYRRYLLIAVAALALAGMVQRHVEQRRVEENLTWTEPENKAPLEISFLALGGFRGLLVDILWVRAIRLQDSAKYYELKLLGELIQELQPSFPHIHAFLAWNMSYNIARRASSPQDQWYWIRSGLVMLEKGLERNKRNYLLWFELGLQYADRLGDLQIGECEELRQKELPNIDELNEEQRAAVFWKNSRTEGRARENEHLRWAAYYFFKAAHALGDPLQIRTERMFGNCLDRLGHWESKKPPAQCQTWDEWGAEDWWVALRQKYKERGREDFVALLSHNLRECLLRQLDFFERKATSLKDTDPKNAAAFARKEQGVEQRFRNYFPAEKKSTAVLLDEYRKIQAQHAKIKAVEH